MMKTCITTQFSVYVRPEDRADVERAFEAGRREGFKQSQLVVRLLKEWVARKEGQGARTHAARDRQTSAGRTQCYRETPAPLHTRPGPAPKK